MEHVIALDIGGTKLAAATVDETGAIGARAQRATGDTDAEALFAAVVDLIATVTDASGERVTACGVGSGGPMTADGALLSPLNIPAWRNFPLRRRLSEHLGTAVWVDNDAKALALAEGWRGAAVGHRDHMAMVVSTGVGGGIVLDGRLLDGAAGNAGHIGHVNVVPDGRRCVCGARGCLEAEASGTAIAAVTGAPASEAGPEVRERTGTLVGRAVGSVVSLLDLPLVTVAGSVALGFGDDFFGPAQAALDAHATIAHGHGARIVPAGLAADGPLVGAAAVAWRGMGHDIGAR